MLVAQRTLSITTGAGTIPVGIRLFLPEPYDTVSHARYEIDWLHWIEPWIGYGFPLPKGARDLLIGHDQQFYGVDPR